MNDALLISLMDQLKKKSLEFTEGSFIFRGDHFFSLLINPPFVRTAQPKHSISMAAIHAI